MNRLDIFSKTVYENKVTKLERRQYKNTLASAFEIAALFRSPTRQGKKGGNFTETNPLIYHRSFFFEKFYEKGSKNKFLLEALPNSSW